MPAAIKQNLKDDGIFWLGWKYWLDLFYDFDVVTHMPSSAIKFGVRALTKADMKSGSSFVEEEPTEEFFPKLDVHTGFGNGPDCKGTACRLPVDWGHWRQTPAPSWAREGDDCRGPDCLNPSPKVSPEERQAVMSEMVSFSELQRRARAFSAESRAGEGGSGGVADGTGGVADGIVEGSGAEEV